jgi:hypothetical protein
VAVASGDEVGQRGRRGVGVWRGVEGCDRDRLGQHLLDLRGRCAYGVAQSNVGAGGEGVPFIRRNDDVQFDRSDVRAAVGCRQRECGRGEVDQLAGVRVDEQSS